MNYLYFDLKNETNETKLIDLSEADNFNIIVESLKRDFYNKKQKQEKEQYVNAEIIPQLEDFPSFEESRINNRMDYDDVVSKVMDDIRQIYDNDEREYNQTILKQKYIILNNRQTFKKIFKDKKCY